MIQVFGIRHHGPGSAGNLQRALRNLQPDCLLVEAPADAEGAIPFIAYAEMKPPVALLIYNPKNLDESVFLPFARFSPEWVAMRYALKADIPIRFMDLPMAMAFTLAREEKEMPHLLTRQEEGTREDQLLQRDPLGFMARLAGFSDSERWWEFHFEQYESESAIFDAIRELMTALREEKGWEKPRTLQREAHMRKVIRKAEKDGFERIAVVCGAWHVPALHDPNRFKQSVDNQLLRGIRKTKTTSSWIPWSYDRLAFESGYGAGVISPAWYELLYGNRREVSIRWLSKAARLFREEDLGTSAAHVMEAVRLADTLATLRLRPVPGIDELQEAAVSVFCGGDETALALIRRRLVIGDVVGKVPPDIPQMPLQRDLESTVKSARLSKEYNSSEAVKKELDLRKSTNLLASRLLHRLRLLNIPWGKLLPGSRLQQGSFKEEWRLQWRPDYAVRVIEAGMLGNTVEEAAVASVEKQIEGETRLSGLTALMEKALQADLPAVVPPLVQRLQETAARSRDTLQLMGALPPLVRIARYGSTRPTDAAAVRRLIDEFVPRIAIGLPGAGTGIDEEEARQLFHHLQEVNHAVLLLNDAEHTRRWLQSLEQLSGLANGHPLLKGAADRRLFERGVIDAEETARRLAYHLSQAQSTASVAHWLEGFLHGSGLLLIHNPSLWRLIDDWLAGLPEDAFEEVLPLLRRTFANFPPPERKKMLDLARQGAPDEDQTPPDQLILDQDRTAIVLPALQRLLGRS